MKRIIAPGKNIIEALFIPCLFLLLPFYIFADCPSMSCPDDRETPIAVYDFEGNLLDSSGHNLDAGENYDGAPVSFYSGIGGRPGTVVAGFAADTGAGVTFSACTFFRDEGEMEWYQYITAPASPGSNQIVDWINNLNGETLSIEMGSPYFGDDMVSVGYTYDAGSGTLGVENYWTECIEFNKWQHCSFQWGPWGTRFIMDGIIMAGSFNQWDKGINGPPYMCRIGTNGTTHGFLGYVDDFTIWPCSSHETATVTPSLSETAVVSATETPAVTPSFTVTASGTITATQSLTAVFTASATPSISATTTPVPMPSNTHFTGIFPNPVRKSADIIFSCDKACTAIIRVYTVSGEKVIDKSEPAQAGMNDLKFTAKNQDKSWLASGVYIYILELNYPETRGKFFRGKLTVIK